MANTVIVAAGGGPADERRETLWGYTRPRWEKLGPVIVGEIDDPDMTVDTYNRSEAINSAAEEATERYPQWDTIVVIDRDVIVPAGQVGYGIAMSKDAGRAVLPYRRYVPYNEQATAEILAGRPPKNKDIETPPGIMTGGTGGHVSSCIIVPRALWEEVGGFDERFVGWGGEDRAFHAACSVYGGMVDLIDGDVYHLWHPRTGTPNSPGFRQNKALERLYTGAKTKERMAHVIAGSA